MQKKLPRRKKVKRPSLNKQYTSRVRQEYCDYDYLDKLSEEELDFLNDFNSEYYNASVGTQADAGKDNRFMKSAKEVKESQHTNNQRNRCIYGKAKAYKKLVNADNKEIDEIVDIEKDANYNYVEDNLIELIDSKNNKDE